MIRRDIDRNKIHRAHVHKLTVAKLENESKSWLRSEL